MGSINDALSFQKDVAGQESASDKPQAWPKRQVQRHPRILFSVPITFQYLGPGGVRTCHGISLDISESGMGALMPHTLPIGDTVGIEFELERSRLRTVAIVRHSSSLRSGFEFVGLTGEERARVAGLVGSA